MVQALAIRPISSQEERLAKSPFGKLTRLFGDWVILSEINPLSDCLQSFKRIRDFTYVSRQANNPRRLTLSASSLAGFGLSKFLAKS